MTLPLEGIIVVEYAGGLSVSGAGLRLADLGARVIRIEERAEDSMHGDACDNDQRWNALSFKTVNRNKERVALDAGDAASGDTLSAWLRIAQVFVHDLPEEIIAQRGLDYATVQAINPRIVYARVSGYGPNTVMGTGPASDLVVQAVSGLCYTTGSRSDPPTPFGLGIGDYLCGQQAVQFIIAALVRAKKNGKGALLELSLFETLIDFQFEFLTTFFESGSTPVRAEVNNANALLSAPYGIYSTRDGCIAIAMMPLKQLNSALQCTALDAFKEEEAFSKRDEIKEVIAEHLSAETTAYWLQRTRALDLWVMPVLDWDAMRATEGYKVLQMEQQITADNGTSFVTTRCPIRINGERLFAPSPHAIPPVPVFK